MTVDVFRRDIGITETQYRVLLSLENGQIQRGKVSNLASSLHRLTDRGFLEYVSMGTGDYYDDVWRLTALGRELMGMPVDEQSTRNP